MTDDAQDALILRHLDGETSQQEVAQVTRLLAKDADFRSSFFSIASLITELQEILVMVKTEPAPSRAIAKGNAAVLQTPSTPPPGLPEKTAGGSSIDYRQIYFNAVLGGAGGLVGWLVMTVALAILPLAPTGEISRTLLIDAFQGLFIGVCIGFAVGSVEGIVASRSLKRLLRGGAFGAALGALGGIIGLVLGEIMFYYVFGGGVWGRAIGWAVFGAFVGTSDGFAAKMPTKIRYGVLGGVLGGLIGGSTYEMISGSDWGKAIGLIIVGACIGALIGLVESLLRKAWLFFITGRLEGQTRTLDSSRDHTLGSHPSCSIVLLRDPTVAPIHAEIGFSDGVFVVCPRDGKVIVRRDGRDSVVTSAHHLQLGDRIQLGQTKMVFRKQE